MQLVVVLVLLLLFLDSQSVGSVGRSVGRSMYSSVYLLTSSSQ